MHLPFFSKNKKNSTNKKQQDQTKEQYYPVCPNCLSPNLRIVKEFTSGWLTTPKYYCPNCNYSGLLFLEIDIKLLETKTPKELRQMFLAEEFEKVDDDSEESSFDN